MGAGQLCAAITMRVPERLRQALPAAIGLVLFAVALDVLWIELGTVSWHALKTDILAIPVPSLALAMLLTALNYAALTGYDFLAFRYIGKALPRAHIAAASFLAYAVSNNVGIAMLSGASVRYRFYTRWGLTPAELSRIVFSYSVTFWLGLFALGGVSLVVSRVPEGYPFAADEVLVPAGWVLMCLPVAYVVATCIRRTPLRIGAFELPLPSTAMAVSQLVLSAVDWALAGAALYVLLPPSTLSFLQFLGLFFVAILIGMVSHVPGGVGVFEGLMVVLLKPYVASSALLPSLVAFRTVYLPAPAVGRARRPGRRRGVAASRACRANGSGGGASHASTSRLISWPSSPSLPVSSCSCQERRRRSRAGCNVSTRSCLFG